MKLKSFIDLFCGIGGFRLALESCGLKCVFSSEIDKDACDTYEKNFGHRPSGDIKAIRAQDIPKHNVLCGGFPCQSFSIAGDGKGFDDAGKGALFFEIVRIAEHHMPEVVFLENVKNLESHDKGRTIKVISEELNRIGYGMFSKVIWAGGFGVPTQRDRVYLVCFRKDLGIKKFRFPKPAGMPSSLADIVLPDSETSKYLYDGDDFTLYGDVGSDPLFDGCVPQRPVRIGEIRGMGSHQGYRIYSVRGHAITLSHCGGGVFADTGAYLINGKVRKLAPRECARIMGFPDSFVIHDNDRASWSQLGNSVAVPVVKAVCERIIEAVAGVGVQD